jgi:hypothetical protein
MQIGASLASLRGLQGHFDDARALIQIIDEFGIGTLKAMIELMSVRVETLAGEPQAVERAARAAAGFSAESATPGTTPSLRRISPSRF